MSLHGPLAGEPFHPDLRGRRVLVVEDNYFVAEDLREELLRWGAEVMGPVATVADALALLEDGPAPDMALLDIKLGDELVYPVADALRARGVPFMFVTGYDNWTIPEAYAAVPLSEKPVAAVASLSRRRAMEEPTMTSHSTVALECPPLMLGSDRKATVTERHKRARAGC